MTLTKLNGTSILYGPPSECIEGIKRRQGQLVWMMDERVTPEGLEEIIQALPNHGTLQELRLMADMTGDVFIRIIQALSKNPHIQRLDFDFSKIEPFDTKAIAEALNTTSIKELSLFFTNVRRHEAWSISDQLSEKRKPVVTIMVEHHTIIRDSQDIPFLTYRRS